MVCSTDDLVVWRDFPKGLRVLLLDEDRESAAETKLKLEAMDYAVSSYYHLEDALEAISRKAESFHVAIVEVTIANSNGSFRFLEMAKDLPTVVISNVRCLSTMMKCIALGAAEFLQKPLSEDKLRNIWQHVVHKAFNAGGDILSESLEPIKETVISMLHLQSETAELKVGIPSELENMEKDHKRENETTEENARLPAPSTPQLDRGRLLDDGDFQDQPNCLVEKENSENAKGLIEVRKYSHFELKSVDNTSNNLLGAVNSSKEVLTFRPTEVAAEEELNRADGSKTDECSIFNERSQPSSHLHDGDNVEFSAEDPKKKKSFLSSNSYSHGNRGNRKRMKVDWTPELHRRFVQAVEQLGIDHAIPSKILELMKVEGLTRHNIASHLQKYRMHRRYILPKDDHRRWLPHKDPMPRGYVQKPIMAFPPFHTNCGLLPSQVYTFWGHPSYHHPCVQMWGQTSYPMWHPPQGSWFWKSCPGVHVDAWGCPVVPPYSQFSIPSKSPTLSNGLDATGGRSRVWEDSCDFYVAEEVIDEVVKEAMSKPWLPLPLGLKSPSTDSILSELHRQGIRTIPLPPRT